MTTLAADTAHPFAELEVATISSDTLRAAVRVNGTLSVASVPLLSSVVRTHIAAGRRYLRIDLVGTYIATPAVLETLTSAQASVRELGGMLVFENAGPCVVDAVRKASLAGHPTTT